MFKKAKNRRAIQVQFVKTNDKDATTAPGEDKILHPETVELIAERSKTVVKYVAIAAVAVYATVTLVDTLSQIAVKKTRSADCNHED